MSFSLRPGLRSRGLSVRWQPHCDCLGEKSQLSLMGGTVAAPQAVVWESASSPPRSRQPEGCGDACGAVAGRGRSGGVAPGHLTGCPRSGGALQSPPSARPRACGVGTVVGPCSPGGQVEVSSSPLPGICPELARRPLEEGWVPVGASGNGGNVTALRCVRSTLSLLSGCPAGPAATQRAPRGLLR